MKLHDRLPERNRIEPATEGNSMEMKTLPQLSKEWPWTLDVIRHTIRQTPALQKLGTTYGATKVYSAAEAKQINDAIAKRAERLRKKGQHGYT